jgi:hypothetical protein
MRPYFQADRTQTMEHGLRHELRNLVFVVKDALLLGRVVILDEGPRIAVAHNFGVHAPRRRWADFIDLEASPFALFDTDGVSHTDGCCTGVLRSCCK